MLLFFLLLLFLMGLSHGFRLVALWCCSCFNYRRDDAAAAATTASHRTATKGGGTRQGNARQGSSAAAPQRIQMTKQSSNNQLTCGVSDVRNVRAIIITIIIFLYNLTNCISSYNRIHFVYRITNIVIVQAEVVLVG